MDNLRVRWLEGLPPAQLPVTQVYGFCFDGVGRILLIHDATGYSLPGGKPEMHESFVETLGREVKEEAQAVIDGVKIFGYQLVEGDSQWFGGTRYAQVRAVARIVALLPPAADPSTGHTYQRMLCRPIDVARLLRWGPTGDIQVRSAIQLARAMWNFRSE